TSARTRPAPGSSAASTDAPSPSAAPPAPSPSGSDTTSSASTRSTPPEIGTPRRPGSASWSGVAERGSGGGGNDDERALGPLQIAGLEGAGVEPPPLAHRLDELLLGLEEADSRGPVVHRHDPVRVQGRRYLHGSGGADRRPASD